MYRAKQLKYQNETKQAKIGETDTIVGVGIATPTACCTYLSLALVGSAAMCLMSFGLRKKNVALASTSPRAHQPGSGAWLVFLVSRVVSCAD